MELRWRSNVNGAIGVAYVTDEDDMILQAVGYYHCREEDFIDEKRDRELVEVWKPNSLSNR